MRRWTMRLAHTRFTVTAGAVIFNDKGEVLLLKHRFRAGSGWGVPGGFMEKGEQPIDALRRELREEIALEVDDVKVFAARSFKKPKQVEVLFRARERASEIANGGSRARGVVRDRCFTAGFAARSATL